jgi:serine/threonine protein kinase
MIRSGLLSAQEVRELEGRWRSRPGASTQDIDGFCEWLIAEGVVTAYQLERLARGKRNFSLGPYKILERVAKGSSTKVFKARRPGGGLVALKVLPPSRARDPEQLAHFERQARAAQRLVHPHVVHTLETAAAGGVHFVVLEFLEGETLAEVLRRRGRLPWPEAVRLLFQILQGLDYLHEQGVVHGHLEPANLMLVPGGRASSADSTAGATVKLLDIGMGRDLFRQIADAAAADLRRLGAGILRGPAADLAPEQARDPRHSDIRADIYSLGCILYHCLTGEPPFGGRSLLHQVVRHATETPRPVQEFDPEIPDWVTQLLERMLAKDPAQRYSTPRHVLDALRGTLGTDHEVSSPPPVPAFSEGKPEQSCQEPPGEEPDSEENLPSEELPPSLRSGRTVRPLHPFKVLLAVLVGALPPALLYVAWNHFGATPPIAARHPSTTVSKPGALQGSLAPATPSAAKGQARPISRP